ncbi:MAG: hypothetical protein ACNA8K_11820 [Cyclonatronaceae bacterium]
MLILALLDREHLDNGPFLKSLSVAVSRLKGVRILFMHSDSDYTDRVMQLGIMRDVALNRSTRELNRRLSALFTEEGSTCVGLNGFQKDCLVLSEGSLMVDSGYLTQILSHSHVILSNMVADRDSGDTGFAEPARMAADLQVALKPDHFIVFSMKEDGSPIIENENSGSGHIFRADDELISTLIPAEIRDSGTDFLVTSLRQFASLPDVSGMLKVIAEV